MTKSPARRAGVQIDHRADVFASAGSPSPTDLPAPCGHAPWRAPGSVAANVSSVRSRRRVTRTTPFSPAPPCAAARKPGSRGVAASSTTENRRLPRRGSRAVSAAGALPVSPLALGVRFAFTMRTAFQRRPVARFGGAMSSQDQDARVGNPCTIAGGSGSIGSLQGSVEGATALCTRRRSPARRARRHASIAVDKITRSWPTREARPAATLPSAEFSSARGARDQGQASGGGARMLRTDVFMPGTPYGPPGPSTAEAGLPLRRDALRGAAL